MTIREAIVHSSIDRSSIENTSAAKAIKMVCLPPAGSSAAIYYPWRKVVGNRLDIHAIEYPGHGMKAREALIDDPAVLASQIAREIQILGDGPMILFGHSLGAALLWRVLKELESANTPPNIILVAVSGRPMQEFIRGSKNRHLMAQDEFIREIKKYNNFPDEILGNADVLEFFLKIFRNDFLLNEQMLNDAAMATNRPLLAVYGTEDPEISSVESMAAWASFSKHWQGCFGVKGDHFYFNNPDSLGEMLQIIASCSSKLLEYSLSHER
jgi:surfactin synthase thioesterase subunit